MKTKFKKFDIVSSPNKRIQNQEVSDVTGNMVWVDSGMCYEVNLYLVKRQTIKRIIYYIKRKLYLINMKFNPINYRIVHKDRLDEY